MKTKLQLAEAYINAHEQLGNLRFLKSAAPEDLKPTLEQFEKATEDLCSAYREYHECSYNTDIVEHLTSKLYEMSALRHGMFTPNEFYKIVKNVLTEELK